MGQNVQLGKWEQLGRDTIFTFFFSFLTFIHKSFCAFFVVEAAFLPVLSTVMGLNCSTHLFETYTYFNKIHKISIKSTPLSNFYLLFSLVQFSSVAQSCLTLWDRMNCSTPGLPVHHQLREFTQIHIHQVGDAIQPSHPLSSPSPLAPNPSQHQSLFQWVNSSHEVAKVLEFQL